MTNELNLRIKLLKYSNHNRTHEDQLFKITTLDQCFHAKPPSHEVGRFNNQINKQVSVSIEEFAELVAQPYGIVYLPSIFNGSRKNANWVSQSLFCLDFDDDTISIEDVIERFEKYGIIPNMYYTTFSDTPQKRKFRFCLFLDQVVTDKSDRDKIAKGLLALFPEADKACKDAARFFYGGKVSEVINRYPINYQVAADLVSIFNIGNDKKNVKRHVVKNVGKNGNPIYNNIGTPISPSKHKVSDETWNRCLNEIQILKALNNGEWLTHLELFGLATNLLPIRGKLKWMEDRMIAFNIENEGKVIDGEEVGYTVNNFNIIPYVKQKMYSPQSLEGFSPYIGDHEYTNILLHCIHPQGHIEIIEKERDIPLEEAELLLNHHLQEALESDDKDIHIIKLPTGIGKTERLVQLDKDVLIACPTHDLKTELLTRRGGDCLSTDRLPEFSSKFINDQMAYYHAIGAYTKVQQLLKQVAYHPDHIYPSNDELLAEQYLENMIDCKNTSGMVLTTHSKAINSNWDKHDTIIFDEDPLNSLIQIGKINMKDLIYASVICPELNPLLEKVKQTPCNQYEKTPTFNVDNTLLIDTISRDRKVKGNIIGLINSEYFMKDIDDNVWFMHKRPVPKKKVIILSATVPTELYEFLYGERVNIVDISHVEHLGEVIQHTKYSLSRSSLKDHLKKIVEQVGNTPVITFGSYKSHFKNPVMNMHFGNCSGYDELKGKDICVVGTPHKPVHAYFFYALAAGLDIKTSDSITCHKKVEWKGMRFSFASFENKELQMIQFSLIESDLLQAAGRNRALREDVRTDVYSNFPLSITKKFVA